MTPTKAGAAEIAGGELLDALVAGLSAGQRMILRQPGVDEHFNAANWKTFCPNAKAFEAAHDKGLIVPWKRSNKWAFTPLGLAVRAHLESKNV